MAENVRGASKFAIIIINFFLHFLDFKLELFVAFFFRYFARLIFGRSSDIAICGILCFCLLMIDASLPFLP